MGSTCTYKPSGMSGYDFLKRRRYFDWQSGETSYTEVDHAVVGSTIYVAIREETPGAEPKVLALVVKTSSYADSRENFCWKLITEDMGPTQCDCPPKILKLLSPTDSKYALDWRAACADSNARRAQRRKIVEGSVIRFTEPLTFNSGLKGSTFKCMSRKDRLWWCVEMSVRVKFHRTTLTYDSRYSVVIEGKDEPVASMPPPVVQDQLSLNM